MLAPGGAKTSNYQFKRLEVLQTGRGRGYVGRKVPGLTS